MSRQNDDSRGDEYNIETVSITLKEGNNFISFPYQMVDTSISGLQNQNPDLDFEYMIGGEYGGTGIFDTNGDGFMEHGNLTTIGNQYAYWIGLRGPINGITDIFELNFDVYQPSDPINYQLIGSGYICPNRTISYDGDDGLSLLDALGPKAPFVQYILGQGVGVWNTCLEQYFENYNNGMDHWDNTYIYSDDCWSGNLSQFEFGGGYWINLFCPGTSGQADGPSPHNMDEYYFDLGGGFTQVFQNFQWERSTGKPPKRLKNIQSDSKVISKIRKMDLDNDVKDRLISDDRGGRIRPILDITDDMEFTLSNDESFYQVNIEGDLNFHDYILVAHSHQNILCGIAEYENLGNKMGYQISVQGKHDASPGTETYPYFISDDETVLGELPSNILNQLKPKFSLIDKRTRKKIKLIGNILNFKTFSLLEVNLNIFDNEIGGFR